MLREKQFFIKFYYTVTDDNFTYHVITNIFVLKIKNIIEAKNSHNFK